MRILVMCLCLAALGEGREGRNLPHPGYQSQVLGEVAVVGAVLDVAVPTSALIASFEIWSETICDIEQSQEKMRELTTAKGFDPRRIELLASLLDRNTNALNNLGNMFELIGVTSPWMKNDAKDCKARAKRQKRGLIDVVGTAFHHLFGVATNADVQKLHETLNHHTNVLRKELMVHAMAFEKVEKGFQMVVNTTNEVIKSQKALWKRSERSAALTQAIEHAEALALQLNDVTSAAQIVTDILVKASHHEVDPRLFPWHQLQRLIDEHVTVMNTEPFFTSEGILKYYELMYARTNDSHLIISVPFKVSGLSMNATHVVPFPSLVDQRLVRLAGGEFVMLTLRAAVGPFVLSKMSLSEFQRWCMDVQVGMFVCPANRLPRFARKGAPCEYAIFNQNKTYFNVCKFDVVEDESIYYLRFSHMHLLYFPQNTPLTVNCFNYSRTMLVKGFINIHEGCAFHSDTISMDAVMHAHTVYIPPVQSWTLPDQDFNITMNDLNIVNPSHMMLSLLNDTQLPYLPLSDPFFNKVTQIPLISGILVLIIVGFVLGCIIVYCVNNRLKEIKSNLFRGDQTAA